MHKLIIRDMQEDDIPAILKIEQISFSTPWSKESFLNEIYKKYAFSKVAVFEGNIIGYICTNYLLHESHILNLAVHPDFWRRGVATILMNESIRELKEKGCVFMYLEVRISNTGAQRFYERFGFKIETIRKKYYGNPDEDALLMMARL
ncbi:MAG: ribosomal-protein-alanine N-acetyltransferase [Thermodesulfovibrio sp. RBG_19FT_COMBO_42_12]|jgi:ribosomal-protein-alanine N-acetyltransferase|nr:MAG: ribosomal-protein-alanine N-acetyltransferase [Thermodesulfovibrio sp. RBG_19FT_COMBO_42_12]